MRPRIYVACLASYNAGRLHGRWIDADQDAEVIREEISEMLAGSDEPFAEEWAIHDHEGFGGYRLSEHESIEEVARIAADIAEHGEVFGALLSYTEDLDLAEELMKEGYCGELNSPADYVEEFMRQICEIPECLDFYIDWERMADDWKSSGDLLTIEVEGKIHLFWNR